MSAPTDADRAKAAATLNYGPDEQVSPMDTEYVEQIAAALAAEREAALAPVLALADEMDREADRCSDVVARISLRDAAALICAAAAPPRFRDQVADLEERHAVDRDE